MKKYLVMLLFPAIFSGLIVKPQSVSSFFPEKNLITTGIYYYPEHRNESQWEKDIKKISDMGYEFVHIAEFAWFKMEPDNASQRMAFNGYCLVFVQCNKQAGEIQ